MPGRCVFVTGTDTGVGKTWVTARLADAARARGVRVAALKAIESGCRATPAGLVGDDDEALFQAAGAWQPERCAVTFEPAVAPGVAAADRGLRIDLDAIAAQVDRLRAAAELTLVEGAGGWLVPLGDGRTIEDLAVRLGAPVLIAARAGLGTISHSLLTVRAVRAAALPALGVALSCRPDDDPVFAERNSAEIARHGGLPAWRLPDALAAALAAVLAAPSPA